MLICRVDDYPGAKPEEFNKHNLQNFRNFEALMEIYNCSPFVLGVVPKHVTDDDLHYLGNSKNVIIALHGINHDERFPNEFRIYETEEEITLKIAAAKHRFEYATKKPVDIYIPPHNVIDEKTIRALVKNDFKYVWGGPGSDRNILKYADNLGLNSVYFEEPLEYGRSDELFQRGSIQHITNKIKNESVYLCLHWTWEQNIGLQHLEYFLKCLDQNIKVRNLLDVEIK